MATAANQPASSDLPKNLFNMRYDLLGSKHADDNRDTPPSRGVTTAD